MPRKGENIYKRKDGRWEGRYRKGRTLDGKIKYGYVYARTYREVKAKMQIQANSNIENTINEQTDLFVDMASMWLKSIRQQIKESTYNKYSNLLNLHILPYFELFALSDITNKTLETYCNNLLSSGGIKNTGLSPKTVTDILSVIRSVLNFAKVEGKNVFCDTKLIQIKKPAKKIRVLNQTEQTTLCRYLCTDPIPLNIGVLVCLFMGLRLGEICALQWEDISFHDQTICVNKTMQRIQNKSDNGEKTKVIVTSPKSPSSQRTIPIPSELLEIIRSYTTISNGYFLTHNNSQFVEPRTMQNHFKRILKKCNIEDVNFHVLRHTFATRCIECGFDVKSLSEILGHASVNITMNRYVHPSMELKKENMKRLSNLLDVR